MSEGAVEWENEWINQMYVHAQQVVCSCEAKAVYRIVNLARKLSRMVLIGETIFEMQDFFMNPNLRLSWLE